MSAENGVIPDMVSDYSGMRPYPEMSLVGYGIAILLVPLLLPLVPFVVLYLLGSWLGDRLGAST